MKTTLILLVSSTALAAVIGLPAWSSMRAPTGDHAQPVAISFDVIQNRLPFLFVSDDDDDHRRTTRYGDDDDDDDHGRRHDDDDDDCDDDDDNGCNRAGNPAPAGTVAPPQNGLFGNGAAPQVQVN